MRPRPLRLLAPLPLLLAAAPAPPLMPGSWEHTIVYVVDTVDGSSLVADHARRVLPSPAPFRVCYTAADLADPRRYLLNTPTQHCRFSRLDVAGGRLGAAGDCTDSRYPAVHVEGSGTYTPTGYDFTFTGHARSDTLTVDFRGRDSGRRVGACPAGGG